MASVWPVEPVLDAGVLHATDEIGDRLIAQAARLAALIASCHERVACPRCDAVVGERCRNLRLRKTRGVTKHPHRERWTQEVPPR